MLMVKMNGWQRLPDTTKIGTISDYLRAIFAGVAAEPLPAAMEKLLRQIEQRVRLQEIGLPPSLSTTTVTARTDFSANSGIASRP